MKRNRTVDRMIGDTYRAATRDALTMMRYEAARSGPLDSEFFARFLAGCELRWAEADRQRREAGAR